MNTTTEDKDEFPITPEDRQAFFILYLEEDKNRSKKTIATYKNQVKTISKAGGDLDGDQSQLLEIIKRDPNPNTRSNKLNAVQQYRIFYALPIDKLRRYREAVFEEIKELTKTKNKQLAVELPTYKYLIEKLKEMTDPRDYFINYLIIYHGLRNRDMHMTYYDETPADTPTDNVIYKDGKGYTLYIVDYKTSKRYGDKRITIDAPRFKKAMKEMNLISCEPLFKLKIRPWNAKTDDTGRAIGGKISDSSFNVMAVSRSIDQLGETKLFKVVVLYLMGLKSHEKLNQIAKDRGTSPGVILEKYNIKNQ